MSKKSVNSKLENIGSYKSVGGGGGRPISQRTQKPQKPPKKTDSSQQTKRN